MERNLIENKDNEMKKRLANLLIWEKLKHNYPPSPPINITHVIIG
jgi:hypothetical protein